MVKSFQDRKPRAGNQIALFSVILSYALGYQKGQIACFPICENPEPVLRAGSHFLGFDHLIRQESQTDERPWVLNGILLEAGLFIVDKINETLPVSLFQLVTEEDEDGNLYIKAASIGMDLTIRGAFSFSDKIYSCGGIISGTRFLVARFYWGQGNDLEFLFAARVYDDMTNIMGSVPIESANLVDNRYLTQRSEDTYMRLRISEDVAYDSYINGITSFETLLDLCECGLIDQDNCPLGPTNSLGMTFNLIPAGTFMMGSPSNEFERSDGETLHQVTLTKSFYMQTTEVTQGQWRAVMGSNPSWFSSCGDGCPVENVSWNDVQGFIIELNKRGEGFYRLPTEAEWEYTARAGTTTPFNTGNCLSTDQANYHGNYPYTGCASGVYRGRTVPVGSFAPNAWGLYDMHGNVSEWVQDWIGSYPSGAVTDPTGPGSGTARSLRGGSWYNTAGWCRSANRFYIGPPVERTMGSGFRLVVQF